MVGKKDTKGTSFPVFLPVPFLAQSLSPSLSFFPVAQPLSYRSSVLQQKGGEAAWCSWLAASPKLRCASWCTSIINLSASLVRAWHIYSLRLSPSLPVSPSLSVTFPPPGILCVGESWFPAGLRFRFLLLINFLRGKRKLFRYIYVW